MKVLLSWLRDYVEPIRVILLKCSIDDIRLFYGNDLWFLGQF
jgi:hypothetical protein